MSATPAPPPDLGAHIVVRLPVHRLSGTDPLALTPAADDPLRPAAHFFPTRTAVKLLLAADAVFAEDVGDPSRYLPYKGVDRLLARGPDPLLVVVVQLDLDTDEIVWLLGVLRWLDTTPLLNTPR